MVGRLLVFRRLPLLDTGKRAAMSDEVTEERTGEDESADGPAVPQEGDAPSAGADPEQSASWNPQRR